MTPSPNKVFPTRRTCSQSYQERIRMPGWSWSFPRIPNPLHPTPAPPAFGKGRVVPDGEGGVTWVSANMSCRGVTLTLSPWNQTQCWIVTSKRECTIHPQLAIPLNPSLARTIPRCGVFQTFDGRWCACSSLSRIPPAKHSLKSRLLVPPTQ